jgi:competence protein ComEA
MKRTSCLIALCVASLLTLHSPAWAQTEPRPAEVAEARTQVDINTADAETLAMALEGIGIAKAREIVAYREQNGEFKSVEDLEQVKGIGPATIARNRDRIVVSSRE